jgi:hypothetical protein
LARGRIVDAARPDEPAMTPEGTMMRTSKLMMAAVAAAAVLSLGACSSGGTKTTGDAGVVGASTIASVPQHASAGTVVECSLRPYSAC